MAIDDEHVSTVISYPTFAELNSILTVYFQIVMSVLEYGMPTFVVRWPEGGIIPSNEEQDRIFKELSEKTKSLKVWPMVRWRNKAEGEYFIRFVPVQTPSKSNERINYVLFVVTLC
ncbi:MAG: hypothetical protein ACFFEM_08605, partial [Candidatus Thorarchaeota archaeon]